MALIGKIRQNSWILIALIALGLGGFIFMDMFQGEQSIFGSSRLLLGEVLGKEIDRREFSVTESNLNRILYSNSDVYGPRKALWDFYVEEAIVSDEAESLGLGVCKSELLDLQFGTNLSPIIAQRFRDPTTQQVSREQLNAFKTQIENNTIDPSLRPFWAHQEKEIIKQRLQDKLGFMVSKGLYTPSWMAKMVHKEQNERADIAYVRIPFDEVDDSEIQITDSKLNQYLSDNIEKYKQDEETRKVAYVTFNVSPTPQDSADIYDRIEDLMARFETAESDSAFAINNYGTYSPVYQKKAQLSAAIADTIFALPVGTVYGPYVDGNQYKAVKLVNKIIVPDSVKSRHILIKAQTQQEYIAAKTTIDSLKNLLVTGAQPFDTLAAKFSEDLSNASKGGVLDFAPQGRMVPPFNNYIFYDGEPGQYGVVATSFGVHLVEVLDRKYVTNEEGVRLAYVNEAIEPSQTTQDSMAGVAQLYMGDIRNKGMSLEELAETSDFLELNVSAPLKKFDFNIPLLGSGKTSRDIVKDAFDSETLVGDILPAVYSYQAPQSVYVSKFVIGSLESVRPAGAPYLEDVKEEVETEVKKQEKIAVLKSRISGTDLSQIAANFSTDVDTARNITFTSGFIQGLGQEPAVVAEALKLDQGQVSSPIGGENGVLVIQVLTKNPAPEPNNLANVKKSSSQIAQNQVKARLMKSIKDNVSVDDYRTLDDF